MASDNAIELHAVIITFRRSAGLSGIARSLVDQTRWPDYVYIFDNEPTVHGARVARQLEHAGICTEYIPSSENIGPAGAAASVMERVVLTAGSDAWLMILNDDIRPTSSTMFAELEAFATDVNHRVERVGAVGRIGHRFDWSRALLVRPADEEIVGAVDVDYLATGFQPMFNIEAIREVGPMRSDYFIGMTEVELGLRLRESGYRLFASADLWNPSRMRSASTRNARARTAAPSWRRYYSLRNLIVLLRDYGHPWTAARISLVRGLIKPAVGLTSSPQYALASLCLNLSAIRDGWTRRMGRRVAPPLDY